MSLEQNAVSLKLPTFWTVQPEVWFVQTEAQFTLRGITTEDTKYFYVIAALDQDTATRLLDLISNPPAENKYQAIKTRLLATFGLSNRERAARLLHFRPLGDSKPSSLMDEMLALLGDHPPCLLFDQLFLERLPEDIRIQLVDVKIGNHRELALKADRLWISRDSNQPFSTSVVRRFVDAKPVRKSSANKPMLTNDPTQLCFYHRTFGEAARRCRPPCTWSGKDRGNQSLVATATGRHPGPLLFLQDSISKTHFLVDTGAEVSVFPVSGLTTRTREQGPPLIAANGSTIPTFGYQELPLKFATNTYRWKFILGSVSRPLLGADFLRSNGLLVDLQGNRLVDATTFTSTPLVSISSDTHVVRHPTLATVASELNNRFSKLLMKFPDITTPNFVRSPAKHGIEHFIVTNGPPIHARARRLSPDKPNKNLRKCRQ